MDSEHHAIRQAGVSVVEVLAAVAIASVLLVASTLIVRPPAASLLANELRLLVMQARLEAIKRNVPVAVIYDAVAGRFFTSLEPAGSGCSGATVVAERRLRDHPRVTLSTDLGDGDGLVWLPSGLARACDLGPLPPRIATLNDGRRTRTVAITTTGRVVIE